MFSLLLYVCYGFQFYAAPSLNVMVDNVAKCYLFFLFFPVTNTFSLQNQLVTEGVLSLTDTSETEVDADIFDELMNPRLSSLGCETSKLDIASTQ